MLNLRDECLETRMDIDFQDIAYFRSRNRRGKRIWRVPVRSE